MTIAQQTRKLNIIESILHIEDDLALDSIEAAIQESVARESSSKPDIRDAIKPIRSNVSLEKLKKEQNYKRITYKEFRAVADKLEWDASVEELLEMLSK
ncbi:MAG: hypothetical protein AAFO82_00400 [Bacteroidota bacterium]